MMVELNRYILWLKNIFFEKYNEISKKISNSMKEEFDTEPISNKKFLKTKAKLVDNEARDFHDQAIPKVGF